MDLPTRFAHDAVRRRGKVYVCSTAAGRILEYDFPSFKLVRGQRGEGWLVCWHARSLHLSCW